jgi:hypothetical protein
MVKCNASAVEMVCSDRIYDYRKYTSDQHFSADSRCLWRQVCKYKPVPKKKFKIVVCAGEVMLIGSWNVKGLVHSEFMPTGMTINSGIV